MTEYEHISPDFKHLMDLNDKERIQSLYEPFWIDYSKTRELFNYLDSLITRPKRDRVQSALLIADPNMGKTTLIKQFKKLYPDYIETTDNDEITNPVKPIIIAEAPPSPSERGFFTAILDGLNVSYRPTDTVAKLNHQTMHLMKTCNVKMLIIDEFHNLSAGTPAKLITILNTIKSMSNTLQIPILAVGIDDCKIIINREPQLASRFELLFLTKWEKGPDFVKLLKQFEERLPLKNASDFGKKVNKDKSKRLLMISRGNLGDLHKLLIECAIEAINTGEEAITLDIINKFEWFKPTIGEARKRVF